jgi:hypothetical protein
MMFPRPAVYCRHCESMPAFLCPALQKKRRICNRACSLAAFTGMKKTFFVVLRKIHV